MAVRPPPEMTIKSGAEAISAPVLLVAGEGQCAAYPMVQGKTFVVGRDPECDIALDHPKISRRHAHIHVGDAVEVEDLGSTNGTLLSGRKLAMRKRVTLDAGRNLQLGPFVAVLLRASGEVSAEQPLSAAIPILDPTPAGIPEVVTRVAMGSVSVLITGETGVGKEVLAHTIHEVSKRSGQFVGINCASLSEPLLESELFGHERGAFTGAAAAKPGLFEVAAGGTVFLDEIGELPMSLQAKLLRVLETRSAYRVGGVKPISLDARIIAATNRNLGEEVLSGGFRRDLYFRVNGIVLTIAPLRERRDAIPGLARELLARAAGPDRKPPQLSPGALDALMRHDWPGNVRELRTVMERACLICEGGEVRAAHIMFDPTHGKAAGTRAQPSPAPPPTPGSPPPTPGSPPAGDGERERIIAALSECAGNQTYAARKLGISRTTLVHKLAVHGIPRPRKGSR
jgi:two-component system, NtrC family, response regulator AtoC